MTKERKKETTDEGDQKAQLPIRDQAPESAEPIKERGPARADCPYHPGSALKSNKSEPFFTRYYCPVAGCQFALKVPRPDMQKLVEDRLRRDEDHSAR